MKPAEAKPAPKTDVPAASKPAPAAPLVKPTPEDAYKQMEMLTRAMEIGNFERLLDWENKHP